MPSAVSRLRSSALELAIALTHLPDLILRRRLIDGHARQLDNEEIQAVLRDASQRFGVPRTWVVTDVVPTVSDVAVLQVGEPQQPFVAYLKMARSVAAADGLLAQRRTLMELQGNDALGSFTELLPKELAFGDSHGKPYIIEVAMPGVPAHHLESPSAWEASVGAAIASITPLHTATGSLRHVDEALFSKWVDPALQTMASLSTSWSTEYHFERIDLLRRRLQRELLGRTLWVSRTHGDFSPNNVLADPQSGRITAIVDWDRSAVDQPAFVDVGQFAIGATMVKSHLHMGAVIRRICSDQSFAEQEMTPLADFWAHHPGDRVSASVVALMVLLRHVQGNVDKAPRYASHRLWVHRTVESVLSNLSE